MAEYRDDEWRKRRDQRQLAGVRDCSLICNKCGNIINEQIPNTRVLTLVDRHCGIVYEWSNMDERFYQNDLRDWVSGREGTPKGEPS